MWMLLLVRMITRVAEPPKDLVGDTEDSKDAIDLDYYVRQDQLRQRLCDYIMADFPARYAPYIFCSDNGEMLKP